MLPELVIGLYVFALVMAFVEIKSPSDPRDDLIEIVLATCDTDTEDDELDFDLDDY